MYFFSPGVTVFMSMFASGKLTFVRREVESTIRDSARRSIVRAKLGPAVSGRALRTGSGLRTLDVETQSPTTLAGSSGVYGVVHGGHKPVSRASDQGWQVGTTGHFLIGLALETGATMHQGHAELASEPSQCINSPKRRSIVGIHSRKVLAILEIAAPLESATSPTRGAAVTASSNRSRRSCI